MFRNNPGGEFFWTVCGHTDGLLDVQTWKAKHDYGFLIGMGYIITQKKHLLTKINKTSYFGSI